MHRQQRLNSYANQTNRKNPTAKQAGRLRKKVNQDIRRHRNNEGGAGKSGVQFHNRFFRILNLNRLRKYNLEYKGVGNEVK